VLKEDESDDDDIEEVEEDGEGSRQRGEPLENCLFAREALLQNFNHQRALHDGKV
jgi:hypothetical protein